MERTHNVSQTAANSASRAAKYADESTDDAIHGKRKQESPSNDTENELQLIQPKQTDKNQSRRCEHSCSEFTGHLEKLRYRLVTEGVPFHGRTVGLTPLQVKIRTKQNEAPGR